MSASGKPEILAPAGNFESLRAAVAGGADAVYLGSSAFSARAKAENFDSGALAEAVKYCHLFGVKVYLAVNTLIKPCEYDDAVQLVKRADKCGIDAFIVQDLPFLRHLHSTMSDIIVHLSTQSGVHNVEGAAVARAIGAKRVVLARETLMSDIVKIKKNVDIEVEYFVHGALCVAFSGNCYFSSLAAGLSGNRGRCLQLCRKRYDLAGKSGYFLSARDLNMTARLAELAEAGVDSFKIEGRMRRPEYVGEAARYYHDAVRGRKVSDEGLRTLFNRGDFCDGYLTDPTADVIYPALASHKGLKIGSVVSVAGGKAKLMLNRPLHYGDGLKFLRGGEEAGGATVRDEGERVGFSGDVRAGDEVNLTTDSEFVAAVSARTRKREAEIFLSGQIGGPLEVTAKSGGAAVAVTSDFTIQKAENRPFTAEEVADCFRKTGGTEFSAVISHCDFPEGAFTVRSALNELRRKTYSALEREILAAYDRGLAAEKKKHGCGVRYDFERYVPHGDFGGIDLLVQTDELPAIEDIEAGKIEPYLAAAGAIAYRPAIYDGRAAKVVGALAKASGKRVFLALPAMLRGGDVEEIRSVLASGLVADVIVNNIGELELCRGQNVLFGPMMNVIDPNFGGTKIMSAEFDGADAGDNFLYAFGRFPVMTFAHCPIRTANGGKCKRCGERRESLSLTDERGNVFPFAFYKVRHCYAQLLNCVLIEDGRRAARRFIDLVGLSAEEKCEVMERLACGKRLWANSTRGFSGKKLL